MQFYLALTLFGKDKSMINASIIHHICSHSPIPPVLITEVTCFMELVDLSRHLIDLLDLVLQTSMAQWISERHSGVPQNGKKNLTRQKTWISCDIFLAICSTPLRLWQWTTQNAKHCVRGNPVTSWYTARSPGCLRESV